MLLATNGATDYWYRATRGWSHPSIRNASVMIGNLLANGANYTISVAAAVGDQERVEQLLKKDDDLTRRLDSARVSPLSYAAREGHLHLVRLLLEHGADPNIPEEGGCDGLALFWACYCMSVQEMKRAIREGHQVVRHEEFLGNVLGKCNAELIDSIWTRTRPLWIAGPAVIRGRPHSSASCLLVVLIPIDPTGWAGRFSMPAPRTVIGPSRDCFLTPAPTSTPEVSSSTKRHWPRQFVSCHGARKQIDRSCPSAGYGWSSSCSSAVPPPTCRVTSRGRHHWHGRGNLDLARSRRFS